MRFAYTKKAYYYDKVKRVALYMDEERKEKGKIERKR
jgi:hypothetical protein